MRIKILNNFVAELLNVKPCCSGEYSFSNPRDGWVFFSSTAETKDAGQLQVSLVTDKGEDTVLEHQAGEASLEAMRFLPAGGYKIRIRGEGEARLKRLVVRAIPEIIYCKFGYDPHVREYGSYDWRFLQRYVLHSVNCIVGNGDERQTPFVKKWKKRCGKWIVECGVPGLRSGKVTAEEAYDYWSRNPGFQNPLMDGVIADEFSGKDAEQYSAWIEAVERIGENPFFSGKTFYAYCGGAMYRARQSSLFVKTLMEKGYRLALERYLSEQPTEAVAEKLLERALVEEMTRWRKAFPGVERHLVICLGIMSAPPESLNVDPSVNYKVFLDMQFNVLANSPAFQGLYGVMTYTSSYADEEVVRWVGMLYRHYCIEGRREMLSRDPYRLTHVENPDFENGVRGWTLYPAEEGSMAVKRMKGYSWLQGRYPRTDKGDTFLWMRRSARRPNVAVQTVRRLTPGKLYSLKMFTADYQDLLNGRSARQRHAVSIELENVELIRDKCFQHVFANCYSHHLGPFDDKHRAWMNYHVRVFRAKAETATLRISDWLDTDKPGGPIGQELAVNFVEIQPYLP